jgi:hypothetical protein
MSNIVNLILVLSQFDADGTSTTVTLNLSQDIYQLQAGLINNPTSARDIARNAIAVYFQPNQGTAVLSGGIITFTFNSPPAAGPNQLQFYLGF